MFGNNFTLQVIAKVYEIRKKIKFALLEQFMAHPLSLCAVYNVRLRKNSLAKPQVGFTHIGQRRGSWREQLTPESK